MLSLTDLPRDCGDTMLEEKCIEWIDEAELEREDAQGVLVT
ncbi:hypothetical protein ABL840_15585 [Variovorax sp. NFACC27]|nr:MULTISPECIES: hypothetical protein [Variovorax]MDP9600554.1 hypothetical protein [Variovorax paradoxus]